MRTKMVPGTASDQNGSRNRFSLPITGLSTTMLSTTLVRALDDEVTRNADPNIPEPRFGTSIRPADHSKLPFRVRDDPGVERHRAALPRINLLAVQFLSS